MRVERLTLYGCQIRLWNTDLFFIWKRNWDICLKCYFSCLQLEVFVSPTTNDALLISQSHLVHLHIRDFHNWRSPEKRVLEAHKTFQYWRHKHTYRKWWMSTRTRRFFSVCQAKRPSWTAVAQGKLFYFILFLLS